MLNARRARRAGETVLVLYTAVTVAMLHRTVLTGDLEHHQVGLPGDPSMFGWHLAWVPYALGHGHSPLFTKLVAAPAGANLMWSTSILAPAALMWPVTSAFGPVVSYNLLIGLALVTNAFVAYVALRRFTPAPLIAALGGAVYGFSPVAAGHTLGHLNLLILAFPPLVLLLLHELFVRQRWSWWITGAALGVAAAVQLLTTEEYVALTGVMVVVVAVAAVVVLRPRPPRHAVVHAVAGLTTAAAVSLAVAAYPLWEQFAGPRRVSGPLQRPGVCVTDLAELVLPTGRQLLTTAGISATTFKYSCYGGEMGGYLGVPLLLALPLLVFVCRRRPAAWLAAVMGVVALVFAAGPRLRIGGTATTIPMPWALVGRAPLLDSVLPDRFMLFAFLAVAWLVVLALTELRSRRVLVVLVLACLVPLLPASVPTTRVTTPALFTSSLVSQVPAGANVLVTPLEDHGYDPMAWQAAAHFRFRMPEGAVFIPGPSFAPLASSPLFGAIRTIEHWAIPTHPLPCRLGVSDGHYRAGSCRVLFLTELRSIGVSAVIVGPGPWSGEIATFFTDLLGEPPHPVGGTLMWAAPVALRPSIASTLGDVIARGFPF